MVFVYKRVVILAWWLLFTGSAQAHNPLIATYLFEQDEQQAWTLTVSTPLFALHQALLQQYTLAEVIPSKGKYNTALAIDYLLNHIGFSLEFSEDESKHYDAKNNEGEIRLTSLKTYLNDHQSDFVFTIKHMPKMINTFIFNITAMSENKGHISLVRVTTPKFNNKVILQAANGYSARLIMN